MRCTVGMSFIGQRHRLCPPDGVGDGFDCFWQQHRHFTPQPQRHCDDELEALPRMPSPMGMAENCQARAPTVMKSRLAIGNKSITQIVCRGKLKCPGVTTPLPAPPALDIFPLNGSTCYRTGQSIAGCRCVPLWSRPAVLNTVWRGRYAGDRISTLCIDTT